MTRRNVKKTVLLVSGTSKSKFALFAFLLRVKKMSYFHTRRNDSSISCFNFLRLNKRLQICFRFWKTSWQTRWERGPPRSRPMPPLRWNRPSCGSTRTWRWVGTPGEPSSTSHLKTISSTFYKQLLRQYSFAKNLQSRMLIREKMSKAFSYEKVASKMLLMQLTPGFFMCRRSEAKVLRKSEAGTTRKNLWYSGFRMASVRNVSVTYLWKKVGKGRSESRSKTCFLCHILIYNSWRKKLSQHVL